MSIETKAQNINAQAKAKAEQNQELLNQVKPEGFNWKKWSMVGGGLLAVAGAGYLAYRMLSGEASEVVEEVAEQLRK